MIHIDRTVENKITTDGNDDELLLDLMHVIDKVLEKFEKSKNPFPVRDYLKDYLLLPSTNNKFKSVTEAMTKLGDILEEKEKKLFRENVKSMIEQKEKNFPTSTVTASEDTENELSSILDENENE